jgi:hypothetical protein
VIARIVFVALAALSLSCRGTLGAHCRCAADCRAGLVCAAEGEKTLSGELCYDPGVVGECIESIEIDTEGGSDGDLTEPPCTATCRRSATSSQGPVRPRR